jgi:hypothetical protein
MSPRKGDIRHSYADITKARKVLEYNPKVDLKDGLTQFVKWYTQRKLKTQIWTVTIGYISEFSACMHTGCVQSKQVSCINAVLKNYIVFSVAGRLQIFK